VLLLALAVIPGFPKIPFIALATFLGLQGMWIFKAKGKEELERPEIAQGSKPAPAPQAPAEEQKAEPGSFDSVMKLLAVDPLELEVGYALIPLIEPSKGGDLLERIQTLRRQLALEMGVVTPPVRIKDNLQLKPTAYVIKVRGVPKKTAELMPDYYMAIDTGPTFLRWFVPTQLIF